MALMACQPKQKLLKDTAGETLWRSDTHILAQAQTLPHLNKDWIYQAKIGVRSKTVKEQANIVWQHNLHSDSIRLFGPLGMGTIILDFGHNGAQLSDSKGGVYQGENASELLNDIVGWQLPIDALSSWLFVRPAPQADYQYRLNKEGRIATIRQLGWQIDYQDYRTYGEQLLPRKVTAFKQFRQPEQGEVVVKLVTKSWQ